MLVTLSPVHVLDMIHAQQSIHWGFFVAVIMLIQIAITIFVPPSHVIASYALSRLRKTCDTYSINDRARTCQSLTRFLIPWNIWATTQSSEFFLAWCSKTKHMLSAIPAEWFNLANEAKEISSHSANAIIAKDSDVRQIFLQIRVCSHCASRHMVDANELGHVHFNDMHGTMIRDQWRLKTTNWLNRLHLHTHASGYDYLMLNGPRSSALARCRTNIYQFAFNAAYWGV